MPTFFHVSASANRASIERHGLDWRRMADATGVAGSLEPELEGIFLCRDSGEAEFFCGFSAERFAVDVWVVDGVSPAELLESPEGFAYVARTVPAAMLTLQERDRLMMRNGERSDSTTYRSSLTIVVDDGPTLHDDAAREWLLDGNHDESTSRDR